MWKPQSWKVVKRPCQIPPPQRWKQSPCGGANALNLCGQTLGPTESPIQLEQPKRARRRARQRLPKWKARRANHYLHAPRAHRAVMIRALENNPAQRAGAMVKGTLGQKVVAALLPHRHHRGVRALWRLIPLTHLQCSLA